MTDKEILIKAISKAVQNGCPFSCYPIDLDLWVEKKLYYSVIFAHDFAQYFWGSEPYFGMAIRDFPAWQYHLQMLVQQEDPVKYLEKYL